MKDGLVPLLHSWAWDVSGRVAQSVREPHYVHGGRGSKPGLHTPHHHGARTVIPRHVGCHPVTSRGAAFPLPWAAPGGGFSWPCQGGMVSL